MSDGVQTTKGSASDSARVPEGWRKPKHGQGMLKPWPKGHSGRPAGMTPSRYNETQQLARSHSIAAVQTLAERLHDPDGRIAVVAANSLLERAWGKVKEAKPEDNVVAQIDLSGLTAEELSIMVRLVQSGRLKAAPEDTVAPVTIDATAG